jgi:hypothetical protein
VPGALEVPLALKAMADSGDYDALIALGCIIRGETYHFELVANESGAGVTRVSLDHQIPIANAILTVENEAQAWARADDKGATRRAWRWRWPTCWRRSERRVRFPQARPPPKPRRKPAPVARRARANSRCRACTSGWCRAPTPRRDRRPHARAGRLRQVRQRALRRAAARLHRRGRGRWTPCWPATWTAAPAAVAGGTRVLLIGAYELTHCIDMPYRVAINEAVELAKSLRRHRRPQVRQRRARQGRGRPAPVEVRPRRGKPT